MPPGVGDLAGSARAGKVPAGAARRRRRRFRVPFIIGYQRARLAVREHIAVEPPTPPHYLILADTFHD